MAVEGLIDIGFWKVMGQRMSKSRKYVFSKKYVLMFVFCLRLSFRFPNSDAGFELQ